MWHTVAIDAPDAADGTPTYTVDVTISGMGTPTGLRTHMNLDTVPNSGSDAIFGEGRCDGTNQWATAGWVPNASTGSRYSRGTQDSLCLKIKAAGATDGELTFNSWITDGVRVNVIENFPAGHKIQFDFWTGTSFACDVNDASSVPDTVTCGFEPQGGDMFTMIDAWDDTATTAFIWVQGYFGWDSAGTLTQGSTNWMTGYVLAALAWRSNLYTSTVAVCQIVDVGTDTTNDGQSITGRTSTAFTLDQTTAVSGGVYDYGWCVWADDPAKSVKVTAIKFATGTGDEVFGSTADGRIEAIFTSPTTATTKDAIVINNQAAACGVGGATAVDNEWCQMFACRDGAVGTCKTGHATTAIECEGFFGPGIARRQAGEVKNATGDPGGFLTDSLVINKTASVATYVLVQTVATWPLATLWIKGNVAIKGNTALNP